MIADRSFSGRKRENRKLALEAANQRVDPLPQRAAADKQDHLIDALQVGFLVGGLVVEIARLAAAAAPSDASGRFRVLDQEQDLAPLGGELAHELGQKVVFTDGEVL